jgi:uncharacterized protein YbjT (DUF2867 family)
MRVAVAGGHGQIALHLTRLLSGTGVEVMSLIRDPDQVADVEAAGGQPVVVDLEALDAEGLAAAIGEAEVVVFAAGAGPGSGAARKETVDHQGAVKLLEAARSIGVDHYVMISAIGADAGHQGDAVFDVYLRAKGRADDAVRSGGVPYTIVRPTSLTNEEPTGTVTLGPTAAGGPISRADVAGVVAGIVEHGDPRDRTLDLTAGPTPIADAVRP